MASSSSETCSEIDNIHVVVDNNDDAMMVIVSNEARPIDNLIPLRVVYTQPVDKELVDGLAL